LLLNLDCASNGGKPIDPTYNKNETTTTTTSTRGAPEQVIADETTGTTQGKQHECSLAVFPFSMDARAPTLLGIAGDPYINKIDTALCQQLMGPPAAQDRSLTIEALTNSSLPLAKGAEQQRVPISTHQHYYVNSSREGDKYYKSFVKSFQISLQRDATKNIKSIVCDYPYPGFIPPEYRNSIPPRENVKETLADCDGYVPALWGGTSVTSNNGTIEWTFGVDTNDWLPVVFGENPTIDPLIGADTRKEQNRTLSFSIKLETKDMIHEAAKWSAVTVSKVLLRNMAIQADAVSLSPPHGKFSYACTAPGRYETGWCSVAVPQQHIEENVLNGKPLPPNFFWYDLGAVATVWKTH
jgi:hypothetical protein